LNLSLKEGASLAGVLAATGRSYFWSGEKHLAARYFNRALVHYKISAVNLPPHVLRELLDVRDLTEELKDYGLSLQYFQLALQEYENKVSEYHLDKLLTLHNLRSLYRRLRDDEKAIYYCKRVIAALQLEDSGNGRQSNCYHDAF